jgi:tight adherence protein B
MMRPDPFVVAAAAALSVALAVIVIFQGLAALREWHLRRDAFRTLADDDSQGQDSAPEVSVVRTRDRAGHGFTAGLAEKYPHVWDLNHLLVQSGLKWTLDGFVTRVVAGSTVSGVVVLLVTRSWWIAGLAFVLAGISPFFYARWKRRRRILQLETQLPEAIDLIARAVRAGHPLSADLSMAAEEGPEPLASEFRITFEEQKFGLPFDEALLGLGDRVDVVDVRILITAILVQREVGGNLSEILETIAETMRARFNLKRQVRVYTAQGRMSGYTLAALPILVGLAITMINPAYMQTLFNESLGRAMLVVAGVMQLIGFLWIRRIVDIRY